MPRRPSPPDSDRPRERLRRLGPGALADRELLALLVGSGSGGASAAGVARRLLGEAGEAGLADLARRTPDGLATVGGVGPAIASRVAAAFELGRRAARADLGAPVRILGPADVAAIFQPLLRDLDQEEFHALLLDRQHRVRLRIQITRGILDASLIHPREVFRRAVEAGSAAVVVAHNHPSGDPSPSAEDRAVTRQLSEAGRVLGIPLLDHVVVARDGWRAISREPGGLEGG